MTEKLKDEERTRCEIYSRVMGYHRPVSSWNLAKQQEHADRKMYSLDKATAGVERLEAQNLEDER